MSRRAFPTACLALLVTACAAQVGVHENVEVPPDAAQTCASQCESIGLTFDGVALVTANVACICAPAPSPRPSAPRPSAETPRRQRAAIAALIAMDDELTDIDAVAR